MKKLSNKKILVIVFVYFTTIFSLRTILFANETEKKIENSNTSKIENKSRKGEEETNTEGIYLTLGALFGVGSLTSTVLLLLDKFYESKKNIPLPVIYQREEGEL